MPSCRVYNNANISINDATLTALTFNTERFDNDTMHSTSSNTGRITFTTAGRYYVAACVQFAVNATGNVRRVAIRLNGATIIADKTVTPVGGSNATIVPISTSYDFAAADYVEVLVYQDSGGALNVEAAGNISPEFMAALFGS